MEWWKNYFSEVYYLAAFSMDRNTKKQVEFIINQTNVDLGSNVLDMCCGYGRHSIELAKRGYSVVGVDYSDELLNKAKLKADKEELSNIEFIQHDIRDYNVVNKYKLTINMFVSLGYFNDNQDNEKAIKVLCDSVCEGGFLFLELYNYYKMYDNHESEMRYPGGNIIITKRSFDYVLNRTHIKRIVKNNNKNYEKEYDMEIKVYTLDEIVKLCEKNNMTVYKCFGDYNGNPFDENSESMLLILKK